MRKKLEILSPVTLAYLWGITAWAVLGPKPLPVRIPTHFNAAGQPDGWGTPAMLWMLPIVAVVIYGLMTLVGRHPSAFNFPIRTAPAVRRRLEAIALNMLACLKVEVICLFAWIQDQTVQFARRGQGQLSPVFLPVVLVLVFATIGWHIAAMRRAARPVS